MLRLQVLAALPWSWPVSVAPIPAGGNATAVDSSCLNPLSDNYLDCCDEYGVALKPYWVLVVSSFIFAFLLGTTKSTQLLRAQIEAEVPERRVAKAAERKAKAASGRCWACWACCGSRWICCESRCPTWFECWFGAGTAVLTSKAKAAGIEARAADAKAKAALWRQWKVDSSCCRDSRWCCRDDAPEQTFVDDDAVWQSGRRFGTWSWHCTQSAQRMCGPRFAAAAAAAAAVQQNAEFEAALALATQKRDYWVWFILGIQLIHAIVSTMMLVLELRARGLQGWELYQAATLLSFNSTLGSYVAAVYGVWLHMGAAVTKSEPAKKFRELWAEEILNHRNRVPDKCPDRKPYAAVLWCATMGAGGIGACASYTNVYPGLVLFLPYVLAGVMAATCFGVTAGALLGMPRVIFGENTAPEGSYLKSAGEALAQTYCILFITAMFVTAVTVSFQFYAGVRWDQAIVNDWEVCTTLYLCLDPTLALLCANLVRHQLTGALIHMHTWYST